MELSQRMENVETQNLSNIILQNNNNENNTYLKRLYTWLYSDMNTISDLNAFNQKYSEDELFCNNVVKLFRIYMLLKNIIYYI